MMISSATNANFRQQAEKMTSLILKPLTSNVRTLVSCFQGWSLRLDPDLIESPEFDAVLEAGFKESNSLLTLENAGLDVGKYCAERVLVDDERHTLDGGAKLGP